MASCYRIVVLPLVAMLCLFGPMSGVVPPGPTEIAPQLVRTDTRIAIAPIAYSNSIPHHMRVAVHATMLEAVQGIAQSALLLDVDAECPTRVCALRQARDAHAEYLLELVLSVDERDYAIEILVIAANDGRQLTEASGACKLCAQAELLAAIAAQVAALEGTFEELSAVESPTVPLEREPEPIDRAEPPRVGRKIGGWVSFALGLAGVGAGAAMLALDGREHGPTCGVDDRDINGACPNVYTTELAGIVSAGLGGVALVTGGGLLISSRGKRSRAAAARLMPAPAGLRLEF
jgi:hypothetical protein